MIKKLDPRTFDNFRELIYEKSGIHLGDGKEALICSRVGKRMRELGINSHQVYLRHILQDESGEETVYLLDAISTNVTRFFRESDHFQLLGKLVEEWVSSGQKRFRIWSAACSTGEEPYSMAIAIQEAIGASYDVKILATDISTSVLRTAQRGVYGIEKMEEVPQNLRERYFERVMDSGAECFILKPILKNMVVFRRLNLSTPPFPMHGPLDVVFCRNVMIYFDNNIRRKLLTEIYKLLKPRGYLMVGHAESLIGLIDGLNAFQPSVYIKAG